MIILLASVRESEYTYVTMEQTRKEVTKMGKYKLIVRLQLLMGRPVTDYDRKALDCYKETPIFDADSNCDEIEIRDEAYERFCAGRPEYRHTESVELVRIA